MSRYFLLGSIMLLLSQGIAPAEEPVYSGPQVGEKLPSFKAQGVFGDLAGKEFDLIQQAAGKPVVLIFFHSRTRPAFGLTNAIVKYAASRANDGLTSGVVFLTDDPTATRQWMHLVEKRFPQGVAYGISADGVEGPGSYGLNRNVTLTVLVGKGGQVTANFALVQPSLRADGPKILAAIVEATGGGQVPSIAELAGERFTDQPRRIMRAADDPKLTSLLRAVINRRASEEDVKRAAAEVEKFVSENDKAREQLGRIANTVVNSGRLTNYGTVAAQTTIRRWAKEFATSSATPKK